MPAAHIHECEGCNGYWPCEAYPCEEAQFSVCEVCKAGCTCYPEEIPHMMGCPMYGRRA
jgi:hypothetical protein